MAEKQYDFTGLNQWLNEEDTPEGIIGRVTRIMINYARTTDADMLDSMKEDLSYLDYLMTAFHTIKRKEN